MKKFFVLAVLLLVAAPAMALTIVNSKHDLSTTGGGGGSVKSDNYDEICVFCHTPHSANMNVTNAPLWNRTDTAASLNVTEFYNSATLNSAMATSTTLNASDAPLCLSCHDGATLAGGLTNPSNLEGNVQPSFAAGDDIVTSSARIIGDGQGLSNDHPVAFVYNAALATADGELTSPTSSSLVVAGGPVQLWDTYMWCSSCHDVHDNEYGAFLVTSNSASALCLTCHIK